LAHWLNKVFTLSGAQPPRPFRWLHRAGLAPILAPPFMALLSLLSGCMLTQAQPTLTPTPIASDGWETLSLGLQRRTLNPAAFVSFAVTRIDPAFYTFRVHYSPNDALTLSEWRARLPDAAAFFNANFFRRDESALGLVVSDGVVYGEAYTDRGGMLQVQNGIVRVRSTLTEPYTGEPLEYAAQAFPMLVANAQAAFFTTRGDRAARRTIVAQDSAGRIVVLSSSSLFGMGLVDLAAYLPSAGLDIVTAVNMDGGGSTLLALYPPNGGEYLIPSFDPVPVVIAAYPR
jgi:uncharacterized protein YigE (DUF2233 family)